MATLGACQLQARLAAVQNATVHQQRVVIHVGTPKSGTTYLQELLWHSRENLALAGICYPGDASDDHFLAVLDLVDRGFHDWRDARIRGSWSRLVESARAFPGTTVISHELLGDLSATEVAAALADLDFAEVHVLATARDLSRQIPAVWVEDVKNRHHLPFADFLEILRPGSDQPDLPRPASGCDEMHGATFWLRQDLPAVLRRWTASLPAERVHVVTLPAGGGDPATLWRRFAKVLGVDPSVGTVPDGTRNASLGRTEAELIRRLNERLDYSLEWSRYAPQVTHRLAADVLPGRTGATPMTVPAADLGWVSARAAAMVEEIRERGYRVVGDLNELLVSTTAVRAASTEPTDKDLLDAALDALAALLHGTPAESAPEADLEPVAELLPDASATTAPEDLAALLPAQRSVETYARRLLLRASRRARQAARANELVGA